VTIAVAATVAPRANPIHVQELIAEHYDAVGASLLARGLRCADDESASLWIIRGIRGTAVAIGAGALAGGLLYAQMWLLVFGVIFLAEELYETGAIALVLRAGRHQNARAG